MPVEQHVRILRFNTLEARRIASRLLRNTDDSDTGDQFEYDGWVWKDGMKPPPEDTTTAHNAANSYYYAIHVMGVNGRLRYPEGHAQAGQLIPGHFIIMAWQGPLSEAPAGLRDNVVTQAQIDATFPDGPPEVMG
jgi:hypothetical protein